MHLARPEDLSSRSDVGHLRPEASVFGGKGRPSPEESERRRLEFLRLIDAGVPFDDAARQARISPWRALGIVEYLVRPLLVKAA